MGGEKRRYLRLKTGQITQLREATESDDQKSVRCNIGNLSKGGVFVETEQTYEEGKPVTFKMRLSNFNADISVVGIVRWTQPTPPKGIGVEFQSVGGDDELQALSMFVDAYKAEM